MLTQQTIGRTRLNRALAENEVLSVMYTGADYGSSRVVVQADLDQAKAVETRAGSYQPHTTFVFAKRHHLEKRADWFCRVLRARTPIKDGIFEVELDG